MGKRNKELKSSIKEEDEKLESEVLRVCNGDDDDDAEANEDLSLKIVQRAILLKDNVAKSDKVATLKNGLTVNDDNAKKNVKKVIKKVVKKVKKKVEKGDTTEPEIDLVSSEKDNGFKIFCSDLFGAEEVKQEEKTEGDKDAVALADIVDNAVQTSPVVNHVLRKLLRGPRYFDPPENGWGTTCYNCGEEGHVTLNCTSARRKKPCFVCGSLEHNVKQCSKGQNCYVCKKQGHLAKNCPNKNECSQISKFCLKCGENGHEMFSCRGNYCPDDLKEIQCYVCGEFGHLCCRSYPDTGPGDVSCYRCGSSGHTGLACARPRGETTGSGVVSSCFKCGEEGHFARECTTSSKEAVKRGTKVSSTKQKSAKPKREKKNPEVTPSPSSHGKGRKKRKANYEERYVSSSSKSSKQKNGWTTEHPRDFHNSHNGKIAGYPPPPATPYYNNVNGWGSPVTPYSNNSVGRWGSPHVTPYSNNGVGHWGSPSTPYSNSYAASGHASTSYHHSRYPGPGNFGSSSSNGYQNGHASQYSNYGNSGDGRHYRWQ